MEERPRRLTRRLATALAVFALAGGWAANARADIAYGFATETISGLTITGATQISNVATSTQDGSTVNGNGPSNSNAFDALQSYQGAGSVPQNTFSRQTTGTNPPVPVAAVGGDFTRGDVLITPTTFPTVPTQLSVVAESFVNTAVAKAETGSAGLSASFSFVAPAAGGVSVTYTAFNDIFAFVQGNATASANYHFVITVKNAAGTIVFNSEDSPTPPSGNTNLSLAAPPNGVGVTRTIVGETVPITGLTANQTFSISFALTAQSAAAAVPEPNVMMLVGASGALTLAVGAVRRRRQRIVTE